MKQLRLTICLIIPFFLILSCTKKQEKPPKSEMIEKIRKDYDMNKYKDEAKVVPFSTTLGDRKGFKILSVKPDGKWQKRGLKEGDVIVKIDDKAVSSPMDLMELYKKIDEDQEVKLEKLEDTPIQ